LDCAELRANHPDFPGVAFSEESDVEALRGAAAQDDASEDAEIGFPGAGALQQHHPAHPMKLKL
jgi:hypothetical protein